MKIAVIMLAAGNSRRFGSNKLLYPVGGVPVYQRMLTCLLETGTFCEKNLELTYTVVTQYEEIAQEARRQGFLALYNPHPGEGISSSVKIGLGANLDAEACLFAVADQPWLSPGTVAALLELFVASGKGIACVSGNGKLGNPCVFSKKYYPELQLLRGDVGGKSVITRHRGDAAVLQAENARELMDMDRKEDCFF